MLLHKLHIVAAPQFAFFNDCKINARPPALPEQLDHVCAFEAYCELETWHARLRNTQNRSSDPIVGANMRLFFGKTGECQVLAELAERQVGIRKLLRPIRVMF